MVTRCAPPTTTACSRKRRGRQRLQRPAHSDNEDLANSSQPRGPWTRYRTRYWTACWTAAAKFELPASGCNVRASILAASRTQARSRHGATGTSFRTPVERSRSLRMLEVPTSARRRPLRQAGGTVGQDWCARRRACCAHASRLLMGARNGSTLAPCEDTACASRGMRPLVGLCARVVGLRGRT